MPNAQVENLALFASNEKFHAVWKLTRALKAAGWRYKASSDGTTKEAGTSNPANDKWGGGVQVDSQTATASFVIGAPTTTSFGGRSTLTGLTGFTSSSPGRYLTITGATNAANNGTWLITKFISATSIVIENPTAVSETTPGTATWTEKDALLDSYPAALQGASGVGAWWCAQGPSTMRVPIGSAVPGTFIRGENVVQATSGATGEFIGSVTDTTTGLGYLVIAPRLSGTGAGPRGWSASATITGDRSAATATPTGTVLEYVRESVIWKNTAQSGHFWHQVIESVTEAATTTTTGRFSTMASLGTATATVCPAGATGGSPVTNGFPTIGTMCLVGTGGSGAATTGSSDLSYYTTNVATGLAQILVANAIEDVGVSPDGSWNLVYGTPASGAGVFIGWGFQRLDDTEDGDVDPYVFCAPALIAAYTRTRTTNTTNAGGTADGFTMSVTWSELTRSPFMGWRRRGMPSGDAFQEFLGAIMGPAVSTATSMLNLNLATPDRVACSFTNIAVREPIWVTSTQAGQKQRKGTLRWWYAVQGGNGTDTYDGRRYVQLSSSTSVPIIVGPADLATNILNG